MNPNDIEDLRFQLAATFGRSLAFAERVKELEQQRDELLVALRADDAYLRHVADCPYCDAGNCEMGVRLGAQSRALRRAVFAKAEGSDEE